MNPYESPRTVSQPREHFVPNRHDWAMMGAIVVLGLISIVFDLDTAPLYVVAAWAASLSAIPCIMISYAFWSRR